MIREAIPLGARGSTVARRRVPSLSDGDRVVALVAPAGYGKSTLAEAWYGACGKDDRASWVTIDKAWRNGANFLRGLLHSTGLEESVPAELMSREVSSERVLEWLLRALADSGKQWSLFFDDAHLLRSSGGGTLLARLITSLPRNTRLVLCGRSGTGLDLSAGTARGLVRWVTQEQLAFDADEVRELAAAEGRYLEQDCVDRVLELTEGWPTLVRFALSIPGAEADRGVIELLMEEMVYEWHFKDVSTARNRTFVAMAAALEFTAAMLEALEIADVAEAIEEGEQLGIVLRRGQSAGERLYVLHPVVGEALLRLGGAGNGFINAVRARCGVWWELRGDAYRAVRVMLAAGNSQRAVQFLRAHAADFVERKGKQEAFLALLAHVEFQEHELGSLLLHAAWANAFLFQPVEATRWLSRADRWLGADGGTESENRARRTTTAVSAMLAVLRDDTSTCLTFANQWVASDDGVVSGNEFERGVAHTAIAWGLKCRSNFFDATAHLRTAQAQFETARSAHGLAWVRIVHVAALIKAGRFRDALAASASALAETDQRGVRGFDATLRAMRALLLLERDERAQARAEVEAALPLLPTQSLVDALIPGYLVAARLCAVEGDIAAALDVLAEGERIGEVRNLRRFQLAMGGERALMLMRNDDVATAERLLKDLGITPEGAQDGMLLDRAERMWARLALVQGHPERVLELTGPAIARARRSDQQHKLAELLMLRAIALSRQGEASGARAAIMEGLGIAALHGYKRIFLDEGTELASLLRAIVLPPQASTPALAHAKSILASISTVVADGPAFLEQRPTEREQQLLAMLAHGLSNVEIADRLEVSEGTVKWHLHNLYAKLKVHNRTGALREAKSRGLLAG
jgi:ATP/maltotriose-dependent transcriptional regulator MalT